MAIVQVENMFYFVLCTLIITSWLQLLEIANAKPLPTHEMIANQTNCYCNSSNLTMMVNGHFLHRWLKLDTHHSITHLSQAAANLMIATDYLPVSAVLMHRLSRIISYTITAMI